MVYNQSFDEPWHFGSTNALSQLPPPGLQQSDGIPFDIRGAIRLRSNRHIFNGTPFPGGVRGIPVERTCRKIHYVYSVEEPLNERLTTEELTLIFADGTRFGLSLTSKKQFPAPHQAEGADDGSPETRVAKTPKSSAGSPPSPILHQGIWINPWPDLEIVALHFQEWNSEHTGAALFAITVE